MSGSDCTHAKQNIWRLTAAQQALCGRCVWKCTYKKTHTHTHQPLLMLPSKAVLHLLGLYRSCSQELQQHMSVFELESWAELSGSAFHLVLWWASLALQLRMRRWIAYIFFLHAFTLKKNEPHILSFLKKIKYMIPVISIVLSSLYLGILL